MYFVRYGLLTLVGGTLGLPIGLVYLARVAARSAAAGRLGVAFLVALGIVEGLVILIVWWSNPVHFRVSESSVVGRSLLGRKTIWLRSTFRAFGETSLLDHIAGTFGVKDESGKQVFSVWSWLMHNGKRLEEDLRSSPKVGSGSSND